MKVEQRRSDPDGIGLEGLHGRAKADPSLRRAWNQLSERGRRVWTPWLVVPYKAVNPITPGATPDLGGRPIPTGDPFWTTPYIVVENSGGIGFVARAGEDNFVHARVFNFGKATAAPTQVDFYWADPSLGLGPGTFNHIGTEWVEVRHSGGSKNVRCNTPWVPQMLNGGHECLMVNTSNPGAFATPGSVYGPFDPISAPFVPWLDRHVGQRNLTVISAASGAMNMSLTLCNLLPFNAFVEVKVVAAMFHVEPGLFERIGEPNLYALLAQLGAGGGKIRDEIGIRFARERPEVGVEIGERLDPIDLDGARGFAARLMEHVGRGQSDESGLTLARVEMGPGERRQIHVAGEMKRASQIDIGVVTLSQHWEGLTLGGYTMIGIKR